MSATPSFRLDGKVALVTGGGHGLGEHIVLALAGAGADVIVVGRDTAQMDTTAAAAQALGVQAMTLGVDVTDVAAVGRMVERAVARFGAIDILVNNAGTNIQQNALEVTEAAWDTVNDVNLKATFFVSQSVARAMIAAARGGRIINIASQMGAVGFFKRAAYCASKGGVVQLTKALAVEWAAYGIRVNAVGPTFIDSPLAREVLKDKEIADEVMRRIPIDRLGRPEEVAAAVIYLASAPADLVTGHHLLVDGGWTAQ
ncbi:2-dehydro-3-deoxy-D-gluconate 5-dehydrogenase [Baekduia alba]|uniref:SDR family NAD(P)-dependent oxidoreductase n=1 Tax=Baekduia alba TaxID=2997333 RepID=UPI00233FF110|nr:glucose 1-dehydrogenase [Baekduia alba]WCB94874.1 2-dehydro-3-deoxy-D-gluconate 5-dehydrogenase [Baekduia alba]